MLTDFLIVISILIIGNFIFCYLIWRGIKDEGFLIWWWRNFICKLTHHKSHYVTKYDCHTFKRDCKERTICTTYYSCHKCNRSHISLPPPRWWVAQAGLEPARPFGSQDFKSCVATVTPLGHFIFLIKLLWLDLNQQSHIFRGWRNPSYPTEQ